jgi:hypothetical protein
VFQNKVIEEFECYGYISIARIRMLSVGGSYDWVFGCSSDFDIHYFAGVLRPAKAIGTKSSDA